MISAKNVVCAVLVLTRLALAQSKPPEARKQPVVDRYHGIQVTDNYRWLEDWSNPETQAWSNAENEYARRYLDALKGRNPLRNQLESILTKPSASFNNFAVRGQKLFALRFQPPKEQRFLVLLRSVDEPDAARVVYDPAEADHTGQTAIDFYVPSRDGRYVAISVSKGGSESGDVRVYETDTGKALSDFVPRVNGGTAGGSLAWSADGSGFYYTRYPRAGEREPADINFYQQLWFHRLGTDTTADSYSLGKDFPRIAEIALKASEDGASILASIENGDGGEYTHYLLGPDGKWVQIARYSDRIISAQLGADGFAYLLSRQDAPRGKVQKVSVAKPAARNATTIIPETAVSIADLTVAGRLLYVSAEDGGPSVVRIYGTDGQARGTVPLEANSAVYQVIPDGRGAALLQTASYVSPTAWSRFDPNTGLLSPTALRGSFGADFGDIEVHREFAVSKDGTRIPISILCKKGTVRNGNNPTLLTGYGGYEISLRPVFNPTLRPLFDRGVVYAVANLRGGGEYGEQWHLAGNLTHKQNVFDDFKACARYLIDQRFTTSSRLAIEGGSNGGLLMGAAFTQHPDLYATVVSLVGIYDMLRVELSPNGSFNVTEFGTVKEADQFKALYAYSPYHHVTDGKQYPAILFLTGVNDPRVDPMNSRKMTARLQATGSRKPVLLRTSNNSGHGIGTAISEYIEQLTDIDSFLFAQWDLD